MQKSFSNCRKCGFNNHPSVKACRKCNSYLDNQTNHQSFIPSENIHKKSFLKFLPLFLIIPLFFAGKYLLSYGQTSVRMVSAETRQAQALAEKQNGEKVEMPDGWYQRSIKSWIWEMPSVEEVLAKDIEVTGGWKALKSLESIEFSADTYSCDCRLNPSVMPDLKSYSLVTIKYKKPGKYFKEQLYPDSAQKYQIFTNGNSAYSTSFIRENEKVYEKVPLEQFGEDNKSLASVAENWAENYENFTDVLVKKFEHITAYSVTATRRKPIGNGFLQTEQLFFDVSTGRFVGMKINQVKVQFSDFRSVKNLFLPHSICVGTDSSNLKYIIKEWKINEIIDDSIFEKPAI